MGTPPKDTPNFPRKMQPSVWSPSRWEEMGVSQNWGVSFFEVPYHKDYCVLGSIMGSPYFGRVPKVELPAWEFWEVTMWAFGFED